MNNSSDNNERKMRTIEALTAKIAALEAHVEIYRTFVENSQDLFYRTNLEGRITYISQSVIRLSGYTVDEAIGMKMAEEVYLVPAERRLFLEQLSRDGYIRNFAARLKRKDGSVWWASTNARICKDADGNILGVEGITRDISDLKAAEAALLESEQHYKNLFETPLVGIFRTRIDDGTFIKANLTAARLLGFSSVEDLMRNCKASDLYPSEERKKNIDLLMREGEASGMEAHYTLKDGREIDISVSAKIFPDKGYLEGVIIDVTDRKQADKALQESEERYRRLANSISDIIWEVEINTLRFTYVNPSIRHMSGYSDQEIKSRKLEELLTPESLKRMKDALSDELIAEQSGTAKPRILELEHCHKDGSTFWAEISARFVRDAQGVPIAIAGVTRDITDRKQMEKEKLKLEAQLGQVQKMEAVGLLAGGIAHDFNNMLSVIIGNVSYALSVMESDSGIREVLANAQEGAKQAQGLTQQLLTFSKGGEPVKKPLSVNRIVKESAAFVTRGATVKCQFRLADDLWTAELDAGQINQAIGNIVINASQAMPTGGIIQIKTENIEVTSDSDMALPAGRYAHIAIEDQGVGIADKYLTNIFEPYFTTKQKGHGLGLATTYSIVRRHGGLVTVDSEVGKGSVFHIYLPASPNASAPAGQIDTAVHRGQGRILVMDDQESILDMLGSLLNYMGYETVFASDGRQAVEMYRKAFQSGERFDLVILDLTIPGGMGGAWAITELKTIDPEVKAVVSSGYSNDPIMANFAAYGFCGVMPKPYKLEQLADLLNRIMGKKGSR